MVKVKFKERLWKWVMEIGNNIWEARKNGFFPYFIILLLFTQTTMGIQPKVITPLQNNFLIGLDWYTYCVTKGYTITKVN
jgi:hypothetical protein